MNIYSDSDLEDVFPVLKHSSISDTDKVFETLKVEETCSKVKKKKEKKLKRQ